MFAYLKTASFWFGIAVAVAVIWILKKTVPAYDALTGIGDFVADVLIIIIVANLAEWVYKKINK